MIHGEEQKTFIQRINSEPDTEIIRKNDDGSLYIPISATQMLLDEIFYGNWSFIVTETKFGRRWARGSGYMEVIHPITNSIIKRNGDAAIVLTGNLRTDSPRLEAMILLSCARKFGRVFGRDLNRNRDDAPLPIVNIKRTRECSDEEERMKILFDDCQTIEELETYKLIVPKSLKSYYETKLNNLKKNEMQ